MGLQAELKQAEASEAEVDEELKVMHSKLEAQLLTKLEQEEEIRSVSFPSGTPLGTCIIAVANGSLLTSLMLSRWKQ